LQECSAGGTAEIDYLRPFFEEAAHYSGNGVNDLLVMGNGAVKHIVEDLGHAIVKDEVSVDALCLKERIPAFALVLGTILILGDFFHG